MSSDTHVMDSSQGLGFLIGYIVVALFWCRERRGVFGLLGFGVFSLLPAPSLSRALALGAGQGFPFFLLSALLQDLAVDASGRA